MCPRGATKEFKDETRGVLIQNDSFNPNGDIVEGRSFNPEPATEESAALIKFLNEDMKHVKNWICRIYMRRLILMVRLNDALLCI